MTQINHFSAFRSNVVFYPRVFFVIRCLNVCVCVCVCINIKYREYTAKYSHPIFLCRHTCPDYRHAREREF